MPPAPPQQIDPFDGVLVVDKPSGPTSHDVVDIIRREFGFKKVGHGGTLDPQATGLLIILIGKGTKLSEKIMGQDKEYEGTAKLGAATDSQDAQGKIISEAGYDHITREQVESAMVKFTGDIEQIPPMVSAVKVDGVPLYRHARKGRTIERQPKLIHIYEFRMTGFRPPEIDFVVRCTKGTYVRTICADMGEMLGCGAYLNSLRRTCSGSIRIDKALALDDVLKMKREELVGHIIPLRNFIAAGV